MLAHSALYRVGTTTSRASAKARDSNLHLPSLIIGSHQVSVPTQSVISPTLSISLNLYCFRKKIINEFSIRVKSRDVPRPSCQPTGGSHVQIGSPLLEAILFPFIEKICLGTAQVDDLRATISIFFLDGALLAVVGVRHAGPPADDAAALVGAIVALVTDAHQGAGPHVGVADHTLAITYTEAAV